MYEVIVNGRNVTNFVSDLQLSDNIDSLSCELGFKIAKNPKDKYLSASTAKIAVGDKVTFSNDKKSIFQGIVINVGLDGSVKSNDYGFYLNKSEIILQCTKVSADNAIKMMCEKAKIPMGEICSIPTAITNNYIGQTPSDILRDILGKATAEQGKNYFFNVEANMLNVSEYPTKPITAMYKQTSGKAFDITWLLGALSGSTSIEEMKNKVIVIQNDNDVVKNLATAEDGANIAKFGLLQKIETLNNDSDMSPQTVANTRLKELNSISESFSIGNIFGSDEVKSGVMLDFNSPSYGLKGKFIVTDVTHNYGITHTMSLTVKRAVIA